MGAVLGGWGWAGWAAAGSGLHKTRQRGGHAPCPPALGDARLVAAQVEGVAHGKQLVRHVGGGACKGEAGRGGTQAAGGRRGSG